MAPYVAKYGVAPDGDEIKTRGCECYAHIPAELREKYFTDKSYRGYFLEVHEPTGSALIYFIELDSVGKSAHVIFDEDSELKERRVTGNFEYLVGMLYRDDEGCDHSAWIYCCVGGTSEYQW